MRKLTEPEIVEKWSHIGMKVFPPQTRLDIKGTDDGWTIEVRWIGETDPEALSQRARGVDLCFPRDIVTAYRESDAEMQVRWDEVIENAIGNKAHGFDPYRKSPGGPAAEKWVISERPAA